MAKEPIDYAEVIRDLERKRTQLNERFDAAIAALRQVLALESTAVRDVQPSLLALTPKLPSHPVENYCAGTIADVSLRHLASVGGGPVPNIELARALNAGGFQHKSKNFPNTLNSVLRRRAMTVGDIRKSERGWELVTA